MSSTGHPKMRAKAITTRTRDSVFRPWSILLVLASIFLIGGIAVAQAGQPARAHATVLIRTLDLVGISLESLAPTTLHYAVGMIQPN